MTQLFLALIPQMSVFVVAAFVVGRTRWLSRFQSNARLRDKLLLAAIGGLMCIAGTYWGAPVHGAIANTRVIGASFAGLIGGPGIGLAAGLIGGLHRYYLGGFTALACGISTAAEGLVSGIVWRSLKGRNVTAWQSFCVSVGLELMQMTIILLFSRPFTAAWELVKIIGLPMITVNSLGSGLVFYILRDAEAHRERIGAAQAKKALAIANQTLPFMRAGLSAASMQEAIRILQEQTGLAAVSLTDGKRILAFSGVGSDHHLPGTPPRTQATRELLADGRPRIIPNRDALGCSELDCPLGGGVAVPLYDKERLAGTLHMFVADGQEISPVTVELAVGLGQLLSTQLELARLKSMEELVTQAELRALQAQINPHFLFNTLNTISVLCRKNPDQAREVIGFLSQYLRSSMRTGEATVTLQEELDLVVAYLSIEQARFGQRLRSRIDVPPGLLHVQVPVFSLQPLVENSVRHGLMIKHDGGEVHVSARITDTALVLTVEDDGVGLSAFIGALPPPKGNGIGLRNVKERLRHLYGDAAQLRVGGRPGQGCTVELHLPRPHDFVDQQTQIDQEVMLV